MPSARKSVLTMFVETNCPSCKALKSFLSSGNIEYVERNIDEAENKVDALMLNIYAVPALVIDDKVLKASEIFDPKNSLRREDILRFADNR